jgi:hypothetical protein
MLIASVCLFSLISECLFTSSRVNTSPTQALLEFKNLYQDMRIQDPNLPTPHVLIETEKISNVYLDVENWVFEYANNGSYYEHFTHLITENGNIKGFEVLTFKSFEIFDFRKMRSVEEKRVFVLQKKQVKFKKNVIPVNKCRGPPHP